MNPIDAQLMDRTYKPQAMSVPEYARILKAESTTVLDVLARMTRERKFQKLKVGTADRGEHEICVSTETLYLMIARWLEEQGNLGFQENSSFSNSRK